MSDWRQFIDDVKAQCDLVALIAEDGHVLQQVGGCWRNAEGWPSLIAWDNGTWKDFGGDRGGDCFSWLTQIRNMEFREAAAYLSDRTGVQLPQADPEALELLAKRRSVQSVLSAAAAHYHFALPSRMRKYLRDHYALTDDTIDELQLGWGDGHLAETLSDAGVTEDDMLAAGLFVRSKGGRLFELFEDRLTFPYWRAKRVRYMIGRRLEGITPEDEWQRAKYKKLLVHSAKHNYVSEHVESGIFYNEDALYGNDEILITEGVTDCIAGMQAEIAIVSPVTVRFREKDIPKLLAMTEGKRVILCNDSELVKADAAARGEKLSAGLKGALSTMRALFEAGRDVRVAILPRPEGVDKIDLCEYLAAHTVAEFRVLTRAALRYPEFLISQIPSDTTEADVPGAIVEVIDLLVDLPAIQQSSYVSVIAKRFKVSRRDLKTMIKDRKLERRGEQSTGDGDDDKRNAIQGQIYAGANYYYYRTREGDVDVVSSFRIEPTQRVRVDDSTLMTGDLHTDKGGVIPNITFPVSAWSTRRQLVSALMRISPDLQWTGSDNQVQGLVRLCADADVPTRDGSTVIGWFDTPDGPRWIGPDCVIGPNGLIDTDELTYVASANPLAKRLNYRQLSAESVSAAAKVILPNLTRLNTPEVMAPIIGWFFAAPFASQLRKRLGHFPGLWVWGTQGSGKTSLVQLFWLMTGMRGGEPFSATETEFSMLKLQSGTNGVPVWLDEYKPGDMPRRAVARLMRFARRNYAGETESRGRPDLTLASYTLAAPMVVSGESLPEEPAIRERVLSSSPNKTVLETDATVKQAYAACRLADLGALAVPYLAYALSRDVDGDLELARTVLHRALGGVDGAEDLPTRVLDNLVVMVFGLIQWEGFAESLGVTVPDIDIERALADVCADLLEGDRGAKDGFDHFLEACSVYAQEKTLVEGTHYAMVNGELRLNMPTAYAVYQRERKRQGLTDDTNGMRALRRVAREKAARGGYVTSVSTRVQLGDGYVRCVAINTAKLPEGLDVEAFPVSAQRSWGGKRWDGPGSGDDGPDGGDA